MRPRPQVEFRRLVAQGGVFFYFRLFALEVGFSVAAEVFQDDQVAFAVVEHEVRSVTLVVDKQRGFVLELDLIGGQEVADQQFAF